MPIIWAGHQSHEALHSLVQIYRLDLPGRVTPENALQTNFFVTPAQEGVLLPMPE
jgi:hypothetical protein